ncbi:MAG TPA: penicillin-binding protein 1B [Solimonas sp.]|nr:penicillin-binding protein 1B [Solimonas sp.]
MAKPRLLRKLKQVLIPTLIVIGSVALAAFSLYLVKLDREIRGRFAGARWALPAQVYAAPLELYPGLMVRPEDLKHELDRLGYREVGVMDGPGTYAAAKDRIEVHTRAFRFWDDTQPSLQLALDLTTAGVTAVQDLEAGAPREIVRLDPMLIGSIYPQQQGEDRALVKLAEVPPLLSAGLIAVEDKGFRWHFGVSVRGIARALWANFRAGKTVQGASTITQQLVKNFFLTNRRDFKRKVKEMLMAMLLEAHYTKDEILEAYLNEIWLGQDGDRAVHGFGLGSQFYFNKPAAELRAHEIAMMVAIVKGPSEFNPRRRPDHVKARRDLVLEIFHEENLLTDAEYKAALAQPLGVVGSKTGGAERYPAFVDLVKRQLRGGYKEEDLTNEGLRIFTTLDPRAQEILERRLVEALPELEKMRKMKPETLEAAGVVTSVDGGEVLALVGGRDVRFSGFNRALDAQRPIGSLAKPFVYLTALMDPGRFNLHTILPDAPVELKMPHGAVWAPRNYDKEFHGPQPLYMALAQSYNLPTVHLGLEVGPPAVRNTMQAAGYTGDVAPLPSLFLGAVDIDPLEVAQMFGTLAAGGFQSPLSAIREVQTLDFQPLSRYPIQVRRNLPEAPVYLLNWALQQVLSFGTGRSAYNILPPGIALAGKTGTTDDYRDSWFAGFGADRVAVVWVGRDDNKPTGLSGASGALPIWARVMKDLEARPLDRSPPADVEEQLTDPATGLRADEGCGNAIVMPFERGYAPRQFAPCAAEARDILPDWLHDLFK